MTPSTILRLLKTVTVPSNVGIDVTKFTAHSIRSASSSKAHVMGASISEIMGCGNWNSSSKWQNFYDKPVISGFANVQKEMLNKALKK